MSSPLLSRFFIVELEPYTYEQFCEITNELLSGHKVEAEVAGVIANVVWNKSRNIRDCVKIGAMAKTIEDVDFIARLERKNDANAISNKTVDFSKTTVQQLIQNGYKETKEQLKEVLVVE